MQNPEQSERVLGIDLDNFEALNIVFKLTRDGIRMILKDPDFVADVPTEDGIKQFRRNSILREQ